MTNDVLEAMVTIYTHNCLPRVTLLENGEFKVEYVWQNEESKILFHRLGEKLVQVTIRGQEESKLMREYHKREIEDGV